MRLLAPFARRRGEGSQEIVIVVRGGYQPAVVFARAGVPVRLTFRREESGSCSDTVLLPQLGRFAELPEGQDVSIECGPLQAGDYEFSGGRPALRGHLLVR